MTWQEPDDSLAHELGAEILATHQVRRARLTATAVDEQNDTALPGPILMQQSA
jgi:hypothetical protein